MSSKTSSRGAPCRVLLLAAAIFCCMQSFPVFQPKSGRVPGLAMAEAGDDAGSTLFVKKVVAAAAQGAVAAMVAAILSACTEPLVNRLLVKRMTFGAALNDITFKMIATFFLTTFPTNMLKFPAFEVINMALSFTSLSGGIRGIVNGFLFCTVMLPVTNYRFRKSMGWEIKPELLYQAYVPTVARDIVYGYSRGFCGGFLVNTIAPETFPAKCAVFGLTVLLACIISSPCNEWRGYTLQPADKKLSFGEYFKPVNYARSTGIGATIMGVSLMIGMLITPIVEQLFSWLKEHKPYAAGGLVIIVALVGVLNKK